MRERGIEAEDIIATLAQKFAAAGYSSRTEIIDATEFQLIVPVAEGQATIVIKRLPDRIMGPTMRLPVSTVETRFEGVEGKREEEVTQLIERSLLRGGG